MLPGRSSWKRISNQGESSLSAGPKKEAEEGTFSLFAGPLTGNTLPVPQGDLTVGRTTAGAEAKDSAIVVDMSSCSVSVANGDGKQAAPDAVTQSGAADIAGRESAPRQGSQPDELSGAAAESPDENQERFPLVDPAGTVVMDTALNENLTPGHVTTAPEGLPVDLPPLSPFGGVESVSLATNSFARGNDPRPEAHVRSAAPATSDSLAIPTPFLWEEQSGVPTQPQDDVYGIGSQIVFETVQHAAADFRPGSRDITLRLDPPELGEVTVELHRPLHGDLIVRISAIRPETQLLLDRHQSEIAQALAGQGFTFDNSSFTSSGSGEREEPPSGSLFHIFGQTSSTSRPTSLPPQRHFSLFGGQINFIA
ncbi:flagellar hook-length control protein FliK [Planctomicrobium sp. SH664]|uniref:flagellar hook-length control protein FliK n=1 Tax=Planctomicrobium sp. SH664 TaxID=3448125 RepID=UPI003F5AFD13